MKSNAAEILTLTSKSSEELKRRYSDALIKGDSTAAAVVINDAIEQKLNHAAIYVEILMPAQVALGDLWHEGKISVAQEHLGTQITVDQMSRLRAIAPERDCNGFRVVVSSIEGDFHIIGARVVSDFLSLDGWQVDFLGIDTPNESLVDFVSARKSHIVAIGVSAKHFLPKLQTLISKLRAITPAPKILLGGGEWLKNSEEIAALSPDAIATDAYSAVKESRRIMNLDSNIVDLHHYLRKIGNKISQLRKTQKLSQGELADASALDRAYISAVENGKQNITIGALLRIANALGIQLEEIIQ